MTPATSTRALPSGGIRRSFGDRIRKTTADLSGCPGAMRVVRRRRRSMAERAFISRVGTREGSPKPSGRRDLLGSAVYVSPIPRISTSAEPPTRWPEAPVAQRPKGRQLDRKRGPPEFIVAAYRARWVVMKFFKGAEVRLPVRTSSAGEFRSLHNALATSCRSLCASRSAKRRACHPSDDCKILTDRQIEILRPYDPFHVASPE